MRATYHHKPKYLSTAIHLRQYDGILELVCLLSYAEIDKASPDEALGAVLNNKPWMNPLVWTVIATAVPDKKQELISIQRKISQVGTQFDSIFQALDTCPSIASLIV
jgi:hypothetical protein